MKSKIKTHNIVDNTMRTHKLFTLVFLKRRDSLLLRFKTRGLGKGLWNGFGGKIEQNESVLNCAKRELLEECNLIAKDLNQLGVVRYDLNFNNSADIVHIFTCSEFDGSAEASEEMNPIKWFKFNDIPFEGMWPDAKSWYPFMLQEKYFGAKITYSDECTITHSDVQEYMNLSQALKLSE